MVLAALIWIDSTQGQGEFSVLSHSWAALLDQAGLTLQLNLLKSQGDGDTHSLCPLVPGSFVFYKQEMQLQTLLSFLCSPGITEQRDKFPVYWGLSKDFKDTGDRLLQLSAGHDQLQWVFPTGFPCTSIAFQFSGEWLARFVPAQQVSIYFFVRDVRQGPVGENYLWRLLVSDGWNTWLSLLVLLIAVVCIASRYVQVITQLNTSKVRKKPLSKGKWPRFFFASWEDICTVLFSLTWH